jgi:hypothetical protein
MKHRSRYLLALTLVATTLCADRLFASNQNAPRPETRLPSEKLVARLTRSFRQVVPRSPLMAQRQNTAPTPVSVVFISTDRAFDLPLSPNQFRLPPPQM